MPLWRSSPGCPAPRPARLRPGYVNFSIAGPPLRLVLNAPGSGPGGTVNHLGVEVDSTEDAEAPGRG